MHKGDTLALPQGQMLSLFPNDTPKPQETPPSKPEPLRPVEEHRQVIEEHLARHVPSLFD